MSICKRCDADVLETVGRAGKRLLLDPETVTEGPRYTIEPDDNGLRAHYLDIFYDRPVNGALKEGHRAHVKSCKPKARLIDWRAVAAQRQAKLERIFEVCQSAPVATDPIAGLGLRAHPIEEIAAIVAEPDSVHLGYLHSTIPDEVQDALESADIEASG